MLLACVKCAKPQLYIADESTCSSVHYFHEAVFGGVRDAFGLQPDLQKNKGCIIIKMSTKKRVGRSS